MNDPAMNPITEEWEMAVMWPVAKAEGLDKPGLTLREIRCARAFWEAGRAAGEQQAAELARKELDL